MNEVIKLLKLVFYLSVATALLIVVLGETGVLPNGLWAANVSADFVVTSMMELSTIILLPLALRLFKISIVSNDLILHKSVALRKWGIIRLCMMIVPLILNTLFYYFFMSATFGYMAIIVLIAMMFIYPSTSRCNVETEEIDDNS